MAVDPPEIHAGHQRPEAEAEADPHSGRVNGLLPEVLGKVGV